MATWTYSSVPYPTLAGIERRIKEAADEGWELVSVTHEGERFIAFLRRPA